MLKLYHCQLEVNPLEPKYPQTNPMSILWSFGISINVIKLCIYIFIIYVIHIILVSFDMPHIHGIVDTLYQDAHPTLLTSTLMHPLAPWKCLRGRGKPWIRARVWFKLLEPIDINTKTQKDQPNNNILNKNKEPSKTYTVVLLNLGITLHVYWTYET